MIEQLILLIISLVAISLASDRFVMGSVRIAETMRISPLAVGVVIIGFGTGLPELMAATVASLHQNPELGISSVLGSTIINSTLVLGTLGAISAPAISSAVLKKEGLYQITSLALFALVVWFTHDIVTYSLLLASIALFIWPTVRSARNQGLNTELEKEAEMIEKSRQWGVAKATVITLASLLVVLASAELLISSASHLALSLGISSSVIGATLVAIGTGLPEWTASIVAARKGHSELVIGNVFGHIIFNSTAVAGMAGVLAPAALHIAHFGAELIFALATAALAWLLLLSGRRLTKMEGWSLIVIYLGWLVAVSL